MKTLFITFDPVYPHYVNYNYRLWEWLNGVCRKLEDVNINRPDREKVEALYNEWSKKYDAPLYFINHLGIKLVGEA